MRIAPLDIDSTTQASLSGTPNSDTMWRGLLAALVAGGVTLVIDRPRTAYFVEARQDYDPVALRIALDLMDGYDLAAIPEDEDEPEFTNDGCRIHFVPKETTDSRE